MLASWLAICSSTVLHEIQPLERARAWKSSVEVFSHVAAAGVGAVVGVGDDEGVGVGVGDTVRVGVDVGVVVGAGEVLIPFAEPICRRVDPAARRIEIDPPEGLVELNQPARP